MSAAPNEHSAVIARWYDDMAFDIDVHGHSVPVDSAPEFGGRDRGPAPKALLAAALAGCTGMDVVSIMRKMKVPFVSFSVEIRPTLAAQHPKVYTHVEVIYRVTGTNIDRDRVEQAVDLSLNKYCGVAATIRHTATIDHQIIIEPADAQS